jgi:enoyl-CoA hydratase/carnithine racemase
MESVSVSNADQSILFDVTDGVAEVKINRPEKMNAMTRAMYRRITELVAEIQGRDDITVAIVTGVGDRAFSAGADLVLYHSADDPPEPWGPWYPDQWDFGTLAGKPMIAAVNGYALAGGLELVLLCDIRIASTSAQFGAAEVKWGLVGGMNTYLLPRTVGSALAMEMLLTGRPIHADQALTAGLVSRVVQPEDLMPTARTIAETIRENPPNGVSMVKELANRGRNLSYEDHLRLTKAYYAIASRLGEQTEGLRSFRRSRQAPPAADREAGD